MKLVMASYRLGEMSGGFGKTSYEPLPPAVLNEAQAGSTQLFFFILSTYLGPKYQPKSKNARG